MTAISKKLKNQSEPQPNFVEVALPIPVRQAFTYSVPTEMQERIAVGSRLQVPFGRRTVTGYAVVFHETLSEELGLEESSIKEVVQLLDSTPLLTEEILTLTQWAAGYYASSWGEMLKASLPAGINATVEEILRITEAGTDFLATADERRTQKIDLLEFLRDHGETNFRRLKKKFGVSRVQRIARELDDLGFITRLQRAVTPKVTTKKRQAVRLVDGDPPATEKMPTPQQRRIIDVLKNHDFLLAKGLMEQAKVGISPIKTLARRGLVEIFQAEVRRDPMATSELPKAELLTLTDEQSAVVAKIEKSLGSESYRSFLLHGVTGSGKTEVYIRIIKRTLKMRKSALMLVPEIALTPVFSKRLRSVFGEKVAILHSSLSTGERFDEWRRIRSGEATVAIGTRSAVFAPLQNIGLIVVDEEHDGSYRQHEMPFYNARDVAIVRANNAKAVIILGSATPAVESFHNSRIGKSTYLSLPNRIGNRPMAKAQIVDMRAVFAQTGKDEILAPELIGAIEETRKKGEQCIILLNRRGFSQFVLCRSCGESIRCVNCDITLTFHKSEQRLVCHYCNHKVKTPQQCPSCESEFIYFLGEGTQQIEKILQKTFPDLRIARVDRDSTKKRRELERVLMSFSEGELDMLVGTQMIAKGHDFPNVTMVGVVSVDAGLSMPDFRSAEKTFQLLTQVAGRAGRGKLPGQVLIQTYYPDHYAIKHAKNQDYDSFYEQEIGFRKSMHYPPFVALASILVKHPNYNYALENAQILRSALGSADMNKHCIILGPAPAPLSRLKGEHRLQILIKSRNRKHLRKTIDFATAEAEAKSCDMKIVYVEIDPINLL